LSAPVQDQTFNVLDDPVLYPFDDGTKTHVGDVLQLSVSITRDVIGHVTIGLAESGFL